MTTEEVITELKSLGFTQYKPNDGITPNAPFTYSLRVSGAVWFYVVSQWGDFKFRFHQEKFYIWNDRGFGDHWLPIEETTDIASVIALYNSP